MADMDQNNLPVRAGLNKLISCLIGYPPILAHITRQCALVWYQWNERNFLGMFECRMVATVEDSPRGSKIEVVERGWGNG